MIPFKIKDTEWTCSFVKEDDKNLKGNMGLARFRDNSIFISENLNEHETSKTLIHELVHAFTWDFGFYQVKFTDEIICDFFSIYGREIIKLADYIINVKGEINNGKR